MSCFPGIAATGGATFYLFGLFVSQSKAPPPTPSCVLPVRGGGCGWGGAAET